MMKVFRGAKVFNVKTIRRLGVRGQIRVNFFGYFSLGIILLSYYHNRLVVDKVFSSEKVQVRCFEKVMADSVVRSFLYCVPERCYRLQILL